MALRRHCPACSGLHPERRIILLLMCKWPRWLPLFCGFPPTARMTAGARMTARRPRPFWRLTAPRAVILELARESSKKEYCFPIYPGTPTRQRASPSVTGSDEPSCCINAQGGCLCSSGFPPNPVVPPKAVRLASARMTGARWLPLFLWIPATPVIPCPMAVPTGMTRMTAGARMTAKPRRL